MQQPWYGGQRVVKPVSSPYDQDVYTVLQVEGKNGTKLVRFLVDSGAAMSIVNYDVIKDANCLQPVTATLSVASSSGLFIKGSGIDCNAHARNLHINCCSLMCKSTYNDVFIV